MFVKIRTPTEDPEKIKPREAKTHGLRFLGLQDFCQTYINFNETRYRDAWVSRQRESLRFCYLHVEEGFRALGFRFHGVFKGRGKLAPGPVL